MPVRFGGEDRTLTAALTGEIDHHACKLVLQTLDRKIDAALPHTLVLDLSGVTFMDSSGIALVLRTKRRMGELSGGLRLTGVPDQAAKVLRAAGIHRLVSME